MSYGDMPKGAPGQPIPPKKKKKPPMKPGAPKGPKSMAQGIMDKMNGNC